MRYSKWVGVEGVRMGFLLAAILVFLFVAYLRIEKHFGGSPA